MMTKPTYSCHIAVSPGGTGWHCTKCKRKLAAKEKCLYTAITESPTKYRMIVECFQCAAMPLLSELAT
jgi:hypothetical protein